MVLKHIGEPLEWTELPDRQPGPGQIRVKVLACGVCRTDLHVADGELPDMRLPVIPGHEIIGRVEAIGPGVEGLRLGERVGVPWLGHACGACAFCQAQQQFLCGRPAFTGYTRDGGFATSTLADARCAFPMGEEGDDKVLAPLLCAGLIGWRSLLMAGTGKKLGLFGFGPAAQTVAQVGRWQGRSIFVFTQPGDRATQAFARGLGAKWAGDSDTPSPVPLDAAIIFARSGGLVPLALKAVHKGGRVICATVHMSAIPSYASHLLWEERQLMSVVNLARKDCLAFMQLVPKVGIVTPVRHYALQDANQALADLRASKYTMATVLVP